MNHPGTQHPKEQRSDSIRERLNAAGLLDEVMLDFESSNEKANVRNRRIARWLKSKNIDTSPSALGDLWATYPDWRYLYERRAAIGLGDDLNQDTRAVLQQQMFVMARRARTAKDGVAAMIMFAENEKLKYAERKVIVSESTLNLKVYESQKQAAIEVDAILAQADKLEALRIERNEYITRGAPDSERQEAIRRRLYGANAALLVTEAPNQNGKEAA
jgi:hypothetical protein